MMFPIFAIFLLFLAYVTYNRHRTEKIEKDRVREFWHREETANATRRKDISSLPYIIIPINELPFDMRPQDEVLRQCESQIRDLAQDKILNLSNMSNTELKLKYGAPNLTQLTQYEQNYTELIRLMNQWGNRLFELSLPAEAECVLTHAIRWGSDIRGSYLLLARIYRENANKDGIRWLKECAGKLNSLMKKPILDGLKEF